MKEGAENKKQFTSKDIHRYLGGQMASFEMHELEKAALEDPFLAEAIDGYQQSKNAATASNDLDELKARLYRRVNASPKKRTGWWQAAAILLLLGGSVAVIYNLLLKGSRSGEREIAASEVRTNNNHAADSVLSMVAPPRPEMLAKRAAAPLEQRPTPGKTPKNNESQAQEQVTPDSANQTLNANAASEAAPIDNKIKDLASQPAAEKPVLQEKAMLQATPKLTLTNTFVGKVVDNTNKPVEGASVLVSNTELLVSTDSSGEFSFSFVDSVASVSVSSPGFSSAKGTLRSNHANSAFVLRPGREDLAKTAARGLPNSTNATYANNNVKNTSVEPVTGWVAFEDYLLKNRKPEVPNGSLHGQVIISFIINAKGRPSDLTVERSLSPACDKEALRLLKEGPAWRALTDKPDRAVIAVAF